MTQIFHLSNHA